MVLLKFLVKNIPSVIEKFKKLFIIYLTNFFELVIKKSRLCLLFHIVLNLIEYNYSNLKIMNTL